MARMTFTDRMKRGACLAFIMTMAVAARAHADVSQPTQLLSGIVNQFSSAAGSWDSAIQQAALKLFWLLAGIEIAWTGIKLALEGADLKQFAGELVRRILFIGFFLAVLLNSQSWSSAIVKSLVQVGANASGVSSLSPDNVFIAGLNVANQVLSAVSQTSVSLKGAAAAIGIMIAALVVIIVFALLAAMLVLALVESYIALNAGIILLGFGGCSWTSDFAKKFLMYCVSVGMKLMVIELIIGVGMQLVTGWTGNYQNIQQSNSQLFCVIGASIVMLALTKSIPDIIQGLVTGVTVSAHTGLATAAAAAGGAALGAGATMAGGGMALKEAALAGWQQAGAGAQAASMGGGGSSHGGSSKSGFPGLASGFKRVAGAAYYGAGAFGSAAAADVRQRVTGEERGFGTMGGRLARRIREENLGAVKSNTGAGGSEGGGKTRSGVSGNISPGGK
jgi:type IV secretion system protein TrbL